MSKVKLRIVQDFVDFNSNKPEGIYLFVNEKDIFINYALIIGPKSTPYFGGFYFFEIKFPKNYPLRSPQVNLLTINNKIRFNPNLYENGKVCLSILGTWSGPGWKSVMNLRCVLTSIQSLLNEYPILNEPGFEDIEITNKKSIEYNYYVIYHNYKLAILDVIDSINSEKEKIPHSKKFKNEIIDELKKNFKELNDNLKSYMITIGIYEHSKFMYFIKNKNILDFLDLNDKFSNIISEFEKKNELIFI